MKKLKNLLKHREIEKLGITEKGGIIIKFNDETHTYIDPDNTKILITNLINLTKKSL